MSITAFPVLARILEERGIQSTTMGTTAIMCAAVDDVCAWVLLAFALTFVDHRGHGLTLSSRLLWLILYVMLMLGFVGPFANWLTKQRHGTRLSYEMVGVVIALVLASAAVTDAIGIHPLFGAFLAGVCFPRVDQWRAELRGKLDTLVSVLLLPMFFALTGMRTRLDLLSGASVWLWTLIILIAAIAGKMGGAVIAARWTGVPWREAIALGALLNTRGMVELIVLNIAYSAGVFSPTLFTMLVVMAIVTTMITVPILNAIGVEDWNRKGVEFVKG